jgi:hypothetical protein
MRYAQAVAHDLDGRADRAAQLLGGRRQPRPQVAVEGPAELGERLAGAGAGRLARLVSAQDLEQPGGVDQGYTSWTTFLPAQSARIVSIARLTAKALSPSAWR